MNDPDFIGYIEKPDVHDGFVLQVQHNGETARVLVKAYDGHLYAFEFDGVKSVISFEPEGMMLYSLSEMAVPQPFRRFVFVNWTQIVRTRWNWWPSSFAFEKSLMRQ